MKLQKDGASFVSSREDEQSERERCFSRSLEAAGGEARLGLNIPQA